MQIWYIIDKASIYCNEYLPFHCNGRHPQQRGNDGHVRHEVGDLAEVGAKYPVPKIVL